VPSLSEQRGKRDPKKITLLFLERSGLEKKQEGLNLHPCLIAFFPEVDIITP